MTQTSTANQTQFDCNSLPGIVSMFLHRHAAAGFVPVLCFGAGAMLAAIVHTRYGRVLPLTLCLIITLISMLMLIDPVAPFYFALSAMLFQFAWSAGIPYFLGAISEKDPTGKILVIGVAMQPGGLSLGPALAAATITPGIYSNVIWLSVSCNIIAFLMIAYLAWPMDRVSERLSLQPSQE